ncbi:MAG TPA: fatty acyl-AMP ligase [Kofleriaceae bacterium]|jgi:acyl-CoA synthetase (AMP-forming)/AMP-acid ligase II|nr:fatty acyl-AMP ligase [Kofleriaceae bacterium]
MITSINTLVDLLRARAETHGARLAFTYLKDGEEIADAWTYQELDLRARRVAAALQAAGSDGDRAILLYPPGLDFVAAFFGCLYARRIAVPISLPNPARLTRELPRLRAILDSAEPRALLTSSSAAAIADGLRAADPAIATLRLLATDGLTDDGQAWRDPNVGSDTLAFLQYTSGSTALPKGVMVSHGNLLHNMAAIAEMFRSTDETAMVSWLPVFHDMGLIGCVLHPMLHGSSNVLMAPAAFLQRPLRWLQAISRFQAHTSGAPNFAYDLCVRRITPEQRATLDLRSWRVAFNGAEPVRARTVAEFTRAFAPCGFRSDAMAPCYGLAESTLVVTASLRGTPSTIAAFHGGDLERGRATPVSAPGPSARELVGCGHEAGGQRLVIVDPECGTQLPDGEIGEIWVAGPSVAQGYWKLPAETETTFHAMLAGSGEGPFLRTGDLGFRWDDQLFIAGRRKDLIIVDGRNHYPQDIELTIEQSHAAFRPGCSAAFAVDVDGAERVVVVAEADPHRAIADGPAADPKATLFRAARRAVAIDHDVDLHQLCLVRPGTIPKTTSGKIRRQACRAGFLSGSLQPWDTPTVTPPSSSQIVPPPEPAGQILRDPGPAV